MRTHPVFLRLEGRRCVVVGGDEAAAAKAAACRRAGADVTLVAPELEPAARAEIAAGVRHVARAYAAGDLAGAMLAYASTRDPGLVARLVADARQEHVLLNVLDVPEACTFFSPAVVERGELVIAIGTGGASPGLAARLRRDVGAQLGPEYAPFVAILGAVRAALPAPRRAPTLDALLASPLLDLVRAGDAAGVDGLLARLVGPDCSLAALGVRLPAAEAA